MAKPEDYEERTVSTKLSPGVARREYDTVGIAQDNVAKLKADLQAKMLRAAADSAVVAYDACMNVPGFTSVFDMTEFESIATDAVTMAFDKIEGELSRAADDAMENLKEGE